MSLQDIHDLYSVPHIKSLEIKVSDGSTLGNPDLVVEKAELTDSLSSASELMFGSCEAACFKLQVATADKEYKNLWLDVWATVQENSGDLMIDNEHYLLMSDGSKMRMNPYLHSGQIGRFKVVLDEPVADRSWRNLTCYDAMYDILRAEVSEWYSGLTFPMTVKALRDSFFSFLGIEQEETTLIHDNLVVQGNFVATSKLSGRTIIKAICELGGVFGHINPEGKFVYLSIPSEESVTYSYYRDGTGMYERDLVEPITGIIARDAEDDAGTIVGTMDNPYIITGNPLVFGIEGTPELENVLNTLLTKISAVTYRPFSVTSYGNPFLPVGTSVVVNTKNMTINSLIMTKRLTGIQALKDSITAKGQKERLNDTIDLSSELYQTDGRYHLLRNDVNGLESEVFDEQGNSKIEQISNEIVLKVDSNGKIVNVELTAEPTGSAFKVVADNIDFISDGKIQLTSKSLEINSTKFKVTSAGAVTCSDITINGGGINLGSGKFAVTNEGALTSTSGTIGGFTIDTTNIRTGTLTSTSDGNIGLSTVAFSRTINGTSRSLRFAIGGNFGVGANGALYSSSGNIGGFTIGSASIYNGMTSRDDTTNNGIWVGTNGIALGKGAFKVTNTGSLTATSGSIGGLTLTSTSMYYNVTSMSDTSHSGIYVGRDGIRIYQVVSASEDGLCSLSAGGITTQFLSIKNSTGAARVVFEANDTGSSTRLRNLTVTGTKSRMSETQDYGNVQLYCYETPTPMFGDVGEGIIAEDGKCYIWTDAKFAQTISNDSYQVFLQKYGQGECYVTERKANYFVVEGDAGMRFGWEIKAKQAGFEYMRLEKEDYWGIERTDFATLANTHIQEIQKEREVA